MFVNVEKRRICKEAVPIILKVFSRYSFGDVE
jgi:hypothetical protein